MHIDWAALGLVALVAIISSVLFIVLLAGGVRCVSAARIRVNQGASGTANLAAGYTFIALAGLLVLFSIWLIVPQFH